MTAQVCPNGAKRTKHHKQRPMQRTNSIQLLDTIDFARNYMKIIIIVGAQYMMVNPANRDAARAAFGASLVAVRHPISSRYW